MQDGLYHAKATGATRGVREDREEYKVVPLRREGERQMPQNVEAEAALIGCALVHAGAYEACSFIRPKHFYNHNYEVYWRSYEEYYEAEGEAPDAITLEDWMRRKDLNAVLEDAPISTLVIHAPNWVKAPSYAKIVFRQWRLREIIIAGTKMATDAYAEPDADAAYLRAEALLRAVGEEVSADNYFPILYDDEAEEREPSDGILGDILYEDTLAILYGQSGRWKSFVALAMGMSLATGLPFAGRIPQRKGPVIYVAAEGGASIGKRITAWKREHRIVGRTQMQPLCVPVQLLKDGQVEKFVATVKARVGDERPLLVVLDTLSRNMAGGDENAGKDGSRAIEQADKIRQAFGCCVLIVAHPGKDDTRGIRGWSGYFAAADTVMRVAASHNNPRLEVGETVKLTSEKPKDSEPFGDIPLTTVRHEWAMPSGRVTSSLAILPGDLGEMVASFADATAATLNDTQKAILAVFDHFPGGMRAADLRRQLPPDLAERTFYHNISQLTTRNLLAKDKTTNAYTRVDRSR